VFREYSLTLASGACYPTHNLIGSPKAVPSRDSSNPMR
jgi:hypothetical protein